MHDRQGGPALGFERAAEADLLAERLRAAEDAMAALPHGAPGWQLARERTAVLLSELEVAVRRWHEVSMPDDPPPEPTLDRRLRRLARAKLESEEQIARARRLLASLREQDPRHEPTR